VYNKKLHTLDVVEQIYKPSSV